MPVLPHITPVFSVDNAAWTPLLTDTAGSPLTTPAAPTATTSTTGGTIAAGTQSYRLTALGASGETLPSTAVTQATTGATSTVTLTWVAVTNATGYKIYGRTAGSELLIATVGVVTTYTDTGSLTPAGALPTSNTSLGGGTATYGTKIDVPGIQMVAVDPNLLVKELFGDNAIIALATKARSIGLKCGAAKLSLDLLASLMGGAVVDAGTTPNQTTTYTLLNSDSAKYGKLEARVLGVELPGAAGGGDLHFIGWKCKLANVSLAANMEDFAPLSFDVTAIQRSSDGRMFSLVENESALVLT